MTEPLIVTPTDCSRIGFCGPGLRAWADQNGFDLRDFLKNGIRAEKLIETGDAFALRAVAAAERRVSGG